MLILNYVRSYINDSLDEWNLTQRTEWIHREQYGMADMTITAVI
jgi:hypothetical protein